MDSLCESCSAFLSREGMNSEDRCPEDVLRKVMAALGPGFAFSIAMLRCPTYAKQYNSVSDDVHVYCRRCNGSGIRVLRDPVEMLLSGTDCPDCHGTGKVTP